MHTYKYKSIEFFILFICIPICFVLNLPFIIKMLIGAIGFLYIIYVLLRFEKMQFKISKNLNWKKFWKYIIIKFLVIIILTTIYVWVFERSSLFTVLINKPVMWISILFIYSFFSVYPQELIYRTFYFQRYESIFQSKALLVFINATVFCLAHLFFRNTLVLALTFLGGVLFALTYYRTKSTLLVSIEHAIYGCWLFTVGMGNMLGFPS